jgi:D-alanyl-D-alanine dipeptidase
MLFRLVFVLLATSLLNSCAMQLTEHRIAIAKAREHGLVDVRQAIPGISVDLRYATRHNVTGRPLYPRDMPCLLRPSTLDRLKEAQATLRAQDHAAHFFIKYAKKSFKSVVAHAGQVSRLRA